MFFIMNLRVVTKNPGKIIAINSAFSKYNINAIPVEKDYEEIQADSSLEIAKFTAIQVAKELNEPVVREDHSLFINYLGIPGPYTKFIEKKMPAEKLLEILKNKDRTGYFEIAAVYAEPNGFTQEFVFKVPIKFSEEIKGNLSSGWNRIIMINGEKRTLSEYPEEQRVNIWDKNFLEIAKFLKNRNKIN